MHWQYSIFLCYQQIAYTYIKGFMDGFSTWLRNISKRHQYCKHGTFLEAFAAREIQIICDQRARNQKQRSGENAAESDSVHAQPDVKASNAELNPGVREPGRSGEFVCTLCGNVYSPEVGEPFTQIAPGLAFEDLPESYACPVCGSGKSEHTAA
jgi:rubredoxin